MTVEEARQRGARLPSMPHVRTFLRLLTGCSRINSDVARRIPGLHRDPKDRLSSLKQVEAVSYTHLTLPTSDLV